MTEATTENCVDIASDTVTIKSEDTEKKSTKLDSTQSLLMKESEDCDPDVCIRVGDYIIIQKQNYKKLHKYNKADSRITIGKDSVSLAGIEGCAFYSTFKLIPSDKKGRQFKLEETDEVLGLKDEIEIKASGLDNRDIIDDGKSQKLTADEIKELANEGGKASDIVETLITNSNTFHNKTEYAQEKYLRKKERKYFEYLQIIRPSIRLIAEIMYKLEPAKIQHLRLDTLSQIMTYSNVQCEGVHLLYDSGSNGLVAAALLSLIGRKTNGKLVHMHPGNMSQKQALLGMNFPEEQYNRCISVNIYSVLRQIYQGCDTHKDKSTTEESAQKRKAEDDDDHKSKLRKTDEHQDVSTADGSNENGTDEQMSSKIDDISTADGSNENGTDEHNKTDDTGAVANLDSKQVERSEPKKPKWHYDNLAAAELLNGKVDSLVIACKEDPLNIFNELLQFVNPSRPFVIYYPVIEPLQKMYVELKANPQVCALKLTCNWMRNYQILPERTHPEVMMNGQSGFLLTGHIIK